MCDLASVAGRRTLFWAKSGFLSGPQKSIIQEIQRTKQKTLLGRGAWEEGSGVRGSRRTALPRGWQSGCCGDGVSF